MRQRQPLPRARNERLEVKSGKRQSPNTRRRTIKSKYDEWRAEEIESYGEVEESDVVQWISDEADYIDSAIDEYCMDIAVKNNIDNIISKFLRNFPYDYDAEIGECKNT